MKKRETQAPNFIPPVNFKELTPEMLIRLPKPPHPLYEKAFLSIEKNPEGETDAEYRRNTTTWD